MRLYGEHLQRNTPINSGVLLHWSSIGYSWYLPTIRGKQRKAILLPVKEWFYFKLFHSNSRKFEIVLYCQVLIFLESTHRFGQEEWLLGKTYIFHKLGINKASARVPQTPTKRAPNEPVRPICAVFGLDKPLFRPKGRKCQLLGQILSFLGR